MFKRLLLLFRKSTSTKEEIYTKSKIKKIQISEPENLNAFDFSNSDEEIKKLIQKEAFFRIGGRSQFNFENFSPLFKQAAYLIVEEQQASASLIQRRLKLGYLQAGEIIDELEKVKIIGPFDGQRAREVNLFSVYQLEMLFQDRNYKDKKHQFFIENQMKDYENLILDKMNQIECEEKVEEEEEIKIKLREEILEKDRDKREKEKIKFLKDKVKKELIEEGKILNDFELQREPIPQKILDKVWNRDSGKCVLCGSQEKIEFDHIIPFSRGGSNTYRNIQILCEKCNRQKSNNIG